MIERSDSKKLYKRWRSMTVAAFASWHVYTILFLAYCGRETLISAAANLTLFGMVGPSNGKLNNNTNGQQARYQQTYARTLDRWNHWNFSLGKGLGAEVNDCMNSIGIRHWLTPLWLPDQQICGRVRSTAPSTPDGSWEDMIWSGNLDATANRRT